MLDRGLAFGDGVFETIRVTSTGPVLMDYHWQRLVRGLQRLSIAVDSELFANELQQFIQSQAGSRQGADWVLKIIVTRGPGERGYQTPAQPDPQRLLFSSEFPRQLAERNRQGLRVFPCQTPVSLQPGLSDIKHLNRLPQVLARQEWSGPDYQEGLMCDLNGLPVEGISSNLFWFSDNKLFTPPLAAGVVAGTLRQWLLDHVSELGISMAEQSITEAELMAVDEWFFGNSLFGVWPVTEYRGQSWSIGPNTQRLGQWLQEQLGL